MALKIGLVGTHGLAWDHLAAFVHSQRVSTVALAEADGGRAAAVRQRFGIIKSVTADYGDLLSDAGIGLVDVCLPAAEQAPVVAAALAAGKDVVVSGPPTATAAEAAALAAAAQAAGRRLWCVLHQRFIPAHVRARDLLREQALRDLTFAGISIGVPQADEPGRLEAEVFHGIDLLQSFLGPIESVSALQRPEPLATLLSLQFAGGVLGQVTVLTTAAEARASAERRLVAPNAGVLIRDNPEDELPLLVFEGDAVFPLKVKGPPNVREYAVIAAVEHLLSCLERGTEPQVTMAEAVSAMQVTDAVAEAASTGCTAGVVRG